MEPPAAQTVADLLAAEPEVGQVVVGHHPVLAPGESDLGEVVSS
jgi:hypothetical protein